MAQGKTKVKSKLPPNVKQKKKVKGGAVTKRNNRPVQPKATKLQEGQKFKQLVSKSVNKAIEEEIRAMASCGPKNISKAQQAVAEHNAKDSGTK